MSFEKKSVIACNYECVCEAPSLEECICGSLTMRTFAQVSIIESACMFACNVGCAM